MKKEVKAALITGVCTILASVIAIVPLWKAGEESGAQKAETDNQVIINSRYDEGYSVGYEAGYKKGCTDSNDNSELQRVDPVNRETDNQVYLGTNVKAYQVGGNNFEEYSISDSNSISISGVKHYRGIIATNHGGGSGWGIYNLHGQYKTLTGIIGHVDESAMHNGYVRFYGDGELLLEYELVADSLGTGFSLDISNVKQLKIEFDFGISASYALANPLVS